MDVSERAALHHALGDVARLRIVDALGLGDLTFQEAADAAAVPGNLAAHHIEVLERAGVVARRVSEGDRRRRYLTLRPERLESRAAPRRLPSGPVLFICTHNSARSQFAASLWRTRTGGDAESAGTDPAPTVHPSAIEAARAWGIDLSGAVPRGYEALNTTPCLVISVCDRARESGPVFDAPAVHWSIPDPVRSGDPAAFRSAFGAIAARIERLAGASSRPSEETRA